MSNAFDEQVEAAKKYLTQTEYNALSVLRPLYDKQAEEIKRLTTQNAWLRELLKEYGRHGKGCNYPFNKAYGCKCGYLREVVPALAEKPRTGAEKPEEKEDDHRIPGVSMDIDRADELHRKMSAAEKPKVK